jgi:hypothetical protein
MHDLNIGVNGTLMRGLALNQNLLNAGAEYVRETVTTASYRMWSIDDQYPAMLRDSTAGASIQLEIWRLSCEAFVDILGQEPPGLCIGKIHLRDQSVVLGILGEPYICEGQKEITQWGGWRKYIASLQSGQHPPM